MECYCREIPKCRNDMRVIRKAMVSLGESAGENRLIRPGGSDGEQALLGRFTEALISQWQNELKRLEVVVSEMEEHDGWYHQQETQDRRASQC